MKMAVCFAPALFWLTGCASLSVQVDTLDPNYAKTAARDASHVSELQLIAQGSHNRADRFLEQTYSAFKERRRSCFEQNIVFLESKNFDAAFLGNEKIAVEQGELSLERDKNEDQKLLRKFDDDIKSLIDRGLPIGEFGTVIDPSIRKLMMEREAEFSSIAAKIANAAQTDANTCAAAAKADNDGQSPTASAEKASELREVAAIARYNANRSIVGGGELLAGHSEAYFVTKAPKEFWAESFNTAAGSGQGGGTSIAIKLNDTGDFSIKGFVFDGTATAQMVKKVTVQAVTLLAAAHGAPVGVSPATSATPASAGFQPSKLFSDQQTQIVAAQAETDAYAAFLFRLSDTLLANWDELKSTDLETRKRALLIVKAGFDAHKTTWKR